MQSTEGASSIGNQGTSWHPGPSPFRGSSHLLEPRALKLGFFLLAPHLLWLEKALGHAQPAAWWLKDCVAKSDTQKRGGLMLSGQIF